MGRNHSGFLLEALRSVPSCEGIEAGKIDLLSTVNFRWRNAQLKAIATNRSRFALA